MSRFQKAVKRKAKLRLGVTGPSGSGKTYSALRLAKGLGGKIAVIDTEKGSASLYADRFDFDVLELTPPYSPQRYVEAIKEAIEAGYEIVITDSISHAWAGEGGLLNVKEQMDSRGGNSFANWAKITPIQEKFISFLINCPVHLILTMRSKQDHVQITEGGKTKIQKVGMAPIQREGFEYELTTVFDIAINHEAETSKDRTGLFVDKIFQITEETGKQLKEWLDYGSEEKEVVQKKDIVNIINTSLEKEIPKQKVIVNHALNISNKEYPIEHRPSSPEIKPIDFENENLLRYGNHIIGFGMNAGKHIKEIKTDQLETMIKKCYSLRDETQKPWNAAMASFVVNAESFLKELANGST